MSEAEPTPGRFRPFRVTAYVTYIAVVSAFVLWISVNVIRSVRAMSPGPWAATESRPKETCRAEADLLWQELERQRQAFATEPSAKDVGLRWSEFRVGWMQRFRAAEAHCARADQAPPELKALFADLEKVQLLYATHANQYGAEVGGAVDRFRRSREALH